MSGVMLWKEIGRWGLLITFVHMFLIAHSHVKVGVYCSQSVFTDFIIGSEWSPEMSSLKCQSWPWNHDSQSMAHELPVVLKTDVDNTQVFILVDALF